MSIFFYFCIENRLFLLLPPLIIMLSGNESQNLIKYGHRQFMYMIDIKIFINLLLLVGQCPECSNLLPQLTVDFSSKKWLAQKVVPDFFWGGGGGGCMHNYLQYFCVIWRWKNCYFCIFLYLTLCIINYFW